MSSSLRLPPDHSDASRPFAGIPHRAVGLSICAGPLWLWGVPLRWFELKSDDFVYLARSRTAASLMAHLFAPHNGHVVPLFMLETHCLCRLAGSLEALPTVLSWASYATLVLSIVLTGHLVAWETGRAVRGLAAMAAVGFTSVLGTALLWYSAGQALAAGTMILAMLVCPSGVAGSRVVVALGLGGVGGGRGTALLDGRLHRGPGRTRIPLADGRRGAGARR